MTLMRFDPFRDLDRLTEQIFGGPRAPRTMPMEAFRRGDQFYVYLDLPGVATEDINLTVERNVVSVKAERRSPRRDGDEVIIDERPHGTFTRQLFLGDNLDASGLSAEYSSGVLCLSIPVAEASKPRRIEVSPEEVSPEEGSPEESSPEEGSPEEGSTERQISSTGSAETGTSSDNAQEPARTGI